MKPSTFLEQLGIKHHLRGFDYIEDAVNVYLCEGAVKTTALYAQIGKSHNVSASAAERCIRSAIQSAINENPDFFHTLGLPETRWGTKFTNQEFLKTVVYRLKELNEHGET